MNAFEIERLRVGDEILLNGLAPAWTGGKFMKVTKITDWGVLCEWEDHRGVAPMRCPWAWIARLMPSDGGDVHEEKMGKG